MSWQHIIQTAAEIAFAVLLLIGIWNHEKLIALEAPIKAAIAAWFRQNIRRRVRK